MNLNTFQEDLNASREVAASLTAKYRQKSRKINTYLEEVCDHTVRPEADLRHSGNRSADFYLSEAENIFGRSLGVVVDNKDIELALCSDSDDNLKQKAKSKAVKRLDAKNRRCHSYIDHWEEEIDWIEMARDSLEEVGQYGPESHRDILNGSKSLEEELREQRTELEEKLHLRQRNLNREVNGLSVRDLNAKVYGKIDISYPVVNGFLAAYESVNKVESGVPGDSEMKDTLSEVQFQEIPISN